MAAARAISGPGQAREQHHVGAAVAAQPREGELFVKLTAVAVLAGDHARAFRQVRGDPARDLGVARDQPEDRAVVR